MSESEYRKLRLHLRVLTISVVVLIALLTANLIHRNFSPKSISFPKIQIVQGPPGKDASVDYGAIDQYALNQINNMVAALPKPQNGVNGQSIQGPPGQSIQGPPGPSGKSIVGPQGIPGQNAPPSPVLQIQIDPITCQLQQKYDTSDIWVSFAQLPKPCEVQ